MSTIHPITTPVTDTVIAGLKTGDMVALSGVLYTARDKAHQRLKEMADNGEPFPFDARGQILYYVGPTPARPGQVIGSAGPTTSYRMDAFTEMVLAAGIKGMIGKGKRDTTTRDLLVKWQAVYFSTYGGAGAYLSKRIISSEIIAFADLGTEAIHRFEVRDFPLIVVNDAHGGDLYGAGGR